MEENTGEQEKKQYEWLKPWQFKPGQSGNPKGLAKGTKSLKVFARQMLQDMTDDEKIEYLKGMDKDKIWEMGEGKPKQDMEVSGNLNISKVLDEIENGQTTDNKGVEIKESL